VVPAPEHQREEAAPQEAHVAERVASVLGSATVFRLHRPKQIKACMMQRAWICTCLFVDFWIGRMEITGKDSNGCHHRSRSSAIIKAGLYRYKKLYRYKGIEYLYRYNLKCAE
jgi:hypothetical protein